MGLGGKGLHFKRRGVVYVVVLDVAMNNQCENHGKYDHIRICAVVVENVTMQLNRKPKTPLFWREFEGSERGAATCCYSL